MINFLIISVLLGSIAYWYYEPKIPLPSWLKRSPPSPNNPLQMPAQSTLNLKRFPFWNRASQVTLFRDWLVSISSEDRAHLLDELPASARAFGYWVATLNHKETRQLIRHITESCKELNLNLTWLYYNELENNPVVQQTLEEVVLLYGIAYARTKQAKDSLLIFNTYREWNKNPLSRKHKSFTLDLFAQLQARGLATDIPTEMAMASNKKRFQFIVREIRNLAEKDRITLNQILELMLLGEMRSLETATRSSLQTNISQSVSLEAETTVATTNPVEV